MKLYFYDVFLDVSNIDFFSPTPHQYARSYPISHRYFTGKRAFHAYYLQKAHIQTLVATTKITAKVPFRHDAPH